MSFCFLQDALAPFQGGMLDLHYQELRGSFMVLMVKMLQPVYKTEVVIVRDGGNSLCLHRQDEAVDILTGAKPLDSVSPFSQWVNPNQLHSVLLPVLDDFYQECDKRFSEELGKLNQYYREIHLELQQRKRMAYHHTYYFEREEQLLEEESRMLSEMKEQGSNLDSRFKPTVELLWLMHGQFGVLA